MTIIAFSFVFNVHSQSFGPQFMGSQFMGPSISSQFGSPFNGFNFGFGPTTYDDRKNMRNNLFKFYSHRRNGAHH
jgi:hypothetical protein